MGTVIGEIAAEYDFKPVRIIKIVICYQSDASLFGAVFIIGGLVGSAGFGIWVEFKKTYKLSVISTVGTAFSFLTGLSWLVTICCFVVGASMIPIMAVGFELGVEVTYPIDESYSTGLLMFAG